MDRYWLFFSVSLDDEPEVEPEPLLELDDGELDEPEPELEGDEGELAEPELDGELDEPEPELEDDEGEDGAGVGVAPEPLLVLDELEPEPDMPPLEDGLLDGEDAPLLLEPLVEPLPAPRSQAAIMLAPTARETATARVESFMYCLLE